MLRRPVFIFFNLFFIIILSGCGCPSSGSSPDKDIVVSVNNYAITRSEFEAELKALPYSALDTPQSRKAFLDSLIDRKLILQYAQQNNLDKDESFLRSIEKFWEQSLLKIALDKKTREIASGISASDWEAKRAEESRLMDEWMNSLRKDARIMIKGGIFNAAKDKDGR
jgi:hypothetical protein